MQGIVWGKTFLEASNQLNNILNNYIDLKINPIKIIKNRNEYLIIFENLDSWRALVANESSRGYRTNISYIQTGISKDIVEQIIIPITSMWPYSAIQYFG